jgi:hypothetical protein
VRITRFDPKDELIVVNARMWSARGRFADLRLAFDTGLSETLIVPDYTDALGYSPRHGEAITVIRSAIGDERGYMLRVARFTALGFSVSDCRIHVHDLPEGYGIDGILGA